MSKFFNPVKSKIIELKLSKFITKKKKFRDKDLSKFFTRPKSSLNLIFSSRFEDQ